MHHTRTIYRAGALIGVLLLLALFNTLAVVAQEGDGGASTLTSDTTYTVVAGDYLAKISVKYGVTIECLVRVNNIANPNLIFVGQQLSIPVSCSGQGGGGAVVSTVNGSSDLTCEFDRYAGRTAPGGTYTVRAGDTLDYIACDFGVSLQCLLDSNPQVVNHKRLAIGEALTIDSSCPAWDGAVIP